MPDAQQDRNADDRVSFIRDEPASEDSFGSHTRLASAIGRVIANDPDIKILGILGPWGSGKSTVVRAIENELTQESQKIHFFTYDAWIHQSDPVRRSFLESLVSFLDHKDRADVSKWNERLESLNGAVEKTETESTPVLTGAGKLLFASLAFVPFGFAIMGYDGAKDTFGIWDGWPAILGLTFSLAPALAALAIYLCWRPWGTKIFNFAFWTNHRAPHQKDSILGILSDRTVDRVLSVTARRPEPTSIEFQEIFHELMTEATGDDHSFVFIIDNLDRLAEREALQIWGAVRAFFLGSSDEPVDKNSPYLPTVILPVDTNSIRRMFAVEHGEGDGEELSKAFMDKTFDVTFEVPEPVLSDWQDYLANQLKGAFRAHINGSEIYWITRFVDEYRRLKVEKITPRLLNRYINRTVATYLQQPSGGVNLTCVAYYVAFADYMKPDLIGFFGKSDVTLTPPVSDWQTKIAAIHYGVESTKASQVLLTQPIKDAIANNDSTTFSDLTMIPGFSVELYRVLSKPAVEGRDNAAQLVFVTNAAMLMHDNLSSEEAWLEDAWRLLIDTYVRSSTPDTVLPDFEHRMQTVLSHAHDSLRRAVVDVTASKIATFLGSTSVIANSFSVIVSAADKLIEQTNAWSIDPPEFRPDVDAGNFVSLLARTSSRPRVWSRLRNNASSTELTAILADRLKTPLDYVTVTPCLRVLLHPNFAGIGKSPKFDWSALVASADDRLRNGGGTEPNVAESAIVLGLLCRHSDAARASLKEVVDQETMNERANEAAAGEQYELVTSAHAFQVMLGGDFGPPAGWSWDTHNEKIPKAAAEIVGKMHDFFGPVIAPQVWTAVNQAPTARALILRLVSTMLDEGRLGNLVVKDVVATLDTYLAPLPPLQQKRFMQLLKGYNNFWDVLAASNTDSNFLRLTEFLLNADDSDRKAAILVVQKRLDQLTDVTWVDEIKNSSGSFSLATKYTGYLRLWGVRTALFAGLSLLIPGILSSTDRDFVRRWFAALDWLTKEAQERAVKAIAEKIADGGFVADLLGILRVAHRPLLESPGFNPSAIVRTVMVPLLATTDGRKWILGNTVQLLPIVQRAGREATAAFQVEVDRLARSPVAGRQGSAEKLRLAFKLK